MRFATLTKDKREIIDLQVRNDDSTAFVIGEPVIFKMDGTNDGLDVEQTSSSTEIKSHFLAGVCLSAIPASGGLGMVRAYGVCEQVKIVRQTRAVSTDTYDSLVAISIGAALILETAQNAFSQNGTNAVSAFLPYCIAIGTIVSSLSTVSTTSDSSTSKTATIKGFIRIM